MSNATETKTAKVLEPQPSAGEATPPGHTEQPAEHTERKDSKKPRHAAEGTQATTAATAPLGTEWYADMSPNVKRLIERKNPQTTADLLALLAEVVGSLGRRLVAATDKLDEIEGAK